MYKAVRFPENPIIHVGLDDDIGHNINGPSLIRVPDWVPFPLGKYYLYFAHHEGTFIRMAYADALSGPWVIYKGGVLHLSETCCSDHIASPDVHVIGEENAIRMYFHGVTYNGQRSFIATSFDGLHFHAFSEVVGPWYLRAFQHKTNWFAIAKTNDAPGGGVLLSSSNGIKPFEQGPEILSNQRHVALLKRDNTLYIFLSRGGDCPERILVSRMSLSENWKEWQPSEPIELLRPETELEGGTLPLCPSVFEAVYNPVNELRDPAIYQENEKLYLLYTGAGETNICVAELFYENIANQANTS